MQQLRLLFAMALLYKHDTEQDSDYQQLHNDRTIYYWHI